jgi:hypothetical protein
LRLNVMTMNPAERMEKRHPHSDATYRVVPRHDRTFGVEVTIPEMNPTERPPNSFGVGGLHTQAGKGARLVSRNRFKHLDTLAAALAKRLRVNDAILDGEIICADETGRPIFIEMLRGRHPMSFVAFDTLWLNVEDLRALPLVNATWNRAADLARQGLRRDPYSHSAFEAQAMTAAVRSFA